MRRIEFGYNNIHMTITSLQIIQSYKVKVRGVSKTTGKSLDDRQGIKVF